MSIFQIDFVSDVDNDRLSVEISYGGQRLCQIYDRPHAQREIEFFTDFLLLPQKVSFAFPLDEFRKILEEASNSLDGR